MKSRLITLANAVAVFAALLAIWQLILWIFRVPPYMLPSPWAVARAVGTRFPSLVAALAITTAEAGGGLIASVAVGVVIALMFAQSRWVRRMLYPYTILLQTVPVVAIAPLILMWVGAGMTAVGLIAFIISLAPVIANTTQGLISVEENLVHLFLMHNASPDQLLFKLRLPHAVPSLFSMPRRSCRPTTYLRWCWPPRYWASDFSFWSCFWNGTSFIAGTSRPAPPRPSETVKLREENKRCCDQKPKPGGGW